MRAIDSRLDVPELLSPAGDWDAMRAAVTNGAQAVYFGLSNFNARHRAANFTLEELPEVMNYLHDHNVRGYVTFNTLIFANELEEAAGFIKACAATGVDAMIVQDLGIAKLIHEMCPTLPVHGSTQMTLTEPRGVRFVESLGATRVILARELSIDDIRKIVPEVHVPVEVFIHGALCVAYSGQCLTSESLGGRSANRGQCAQACRLPYDLIVNGEHRDLGEKSYLLSPQDLAAHDLIDDLTRAGVASFKIEGRLKSAHYVAATTKTYRQAIDAAAAHRPFKLGASEQDELAQSFSRGFTHGFLGGVNHQELVHARFPKKRGIHVGNVIDKTREGLIVELVGSTSHPNQAAPRQNTPARPMNNAAIKPGDGIVFDEGHPDQDEQGGRVFVVRPVGRNQVEVQLGSGDISLSAIAVGSLVWKTDDPAIRKRLEQTFSRDVVQHRAPVHVQVFARVGQHLIIRMRDDAGHVAKAEWDKKLELAQKFPITETLVREQMERLGSTPFEMRSLKIEADAVMVPKSVLNDLRRACVEQLMVHRLKKHTIGKPEALAEWRAVRAEVPAESFENKRDSTGESRSQATADQTPLLSVLVRTQDQLEALFTSSLPIDFIYCDFEDVRRHKDAIQRARRAGRKVGIATTRIIKPGEDGLIRHAAQCEPDAILVRNLAALDLLRQEYPHLPLIGDYALNIANDLTARIFLEKGLTRLTPSYDLNYRELQSMIEQTDPSIWEVTIHQHMPMFHMEHCVFSHTLSNGTDYRTCGRPCDTHKVDFRDRMGKPHPLIADVGCRNTVYNADAQTAAEYVPDLMRLGIQHFRVEMLRESADQVVPFLSRYIEVMAGQVAPKVALRSLRVLSQLGVTRGTLGRD